MEHLDNLIGGQWVEGDELAPNVNPSNTQDIIGEFARADAAAVDAAVEAARAALPRPAW